MLLLERACVRACLRVVPPSYLQQFRIGVTMYGGGLRVKSLVGVGDQESVVMSQTRFVWTV